MNIISGYSVIMSDFIKHETQQHNYFSYYFDIYSPYLLTDLVEL